jgi:hypothetical protein
MIYCILFDSNDIDIVMQWQVKIIQWVFFTIRIFSSPFDQFELYLSGILLFIYFRLGITSRKTYFEPTERFGQKIVKIDQDCET